jgi:hypothetical protein
MFCPQCGTAHTPGGRFCGNCGLLLPFAVLAGAVPEAPVAPAPIALFATTSGEHTSAKPSSFAVAVVACVVAFGVFFLAASTIVRIVIGDDHPMSATAAAPDTSQGALGALLSTRRTQPADHGKLK